MPNCRLYNPVATLPSFLPLAAGFFFSMRRNDHIEALVRISALKIAKGNTARAEELLKWAYAPVVKRQTQFDLGDDEEDEDEAPSPALAFQFIEMALKPELTFYKRDVKRFADAYVRNPSDRIDYSRVKGYILGMDYHDFLNTLYWRGVSLLVKERAGNKCEMCGATRNLVTHHRHYLNHGDEIHHPEDLQCLCKDCHERVHGIRKPEPAAIQRPMRTPKLGSAISIRQIIEEETTR